MWVHCDFRARAIDSKNLRRITVARTYNMYETVEGIRAMFTKT
jgi:hypothetical protein